jgi:hypothetical protein
VLESLEWPTLHPVSRQPRSAAAVASVCHGLLLGAARAIPTLRARGLLEGTARAMPTLAARGLIRTCSKVVSTGSRSPQLDEWNR